jgi:hypothetical protein
MYGNLVNYGNKRETKFCFETTISNPEIHVYMTEYPNDLLAWFAPSRLSLEPSIQASIALSSERLLTFVFSLVMSPAPYTAYFFRPGNSVVTVGQPLCIGSCSQPSHVRSHFMSPSGLDHPAYMRCIPSCRLPSLRVTGLSSGTGIAGLL